MRLETDGRRVVRVLEGGAAPLVFTPLLNLSKIKRPDIIDDF